MNNLRPKTEQRYDNFNRKYKCLGVVGKGAYGSVSCYEDIKTKKKVAVKQFFMRSGKDDGIPITLCREINLLRELEHENVLKVQDVVIHNDGSFNMILDYCKLDLERLLAYHKTLMRLPQGPPLPPKLDDGMIKSIMYQILKGIQYLHSKWVIHRDLKPSNILINDDSHADRGVVKVADFGLARVFKAPLRRFHDDGPVVTIWYRAPELLMGAKHYTPAIDIWSVGCIMYELFELKPLFKGEEVKQNNNPNPFQRDQLDKIFTVLGKPNDQIWPTINSLPESKHLASFSETTNTLESVFKMPKESLEYDLLRQLLEYDPAKRITAKEALQHKYFKDKPSNK
ncbi:predicted protein [Naegleria gruberi]|uniref:Cyclin-dependent kinase 8 n=1 Tax=Naegleria gruberi TaxID=5762 RepID=D2VMC2_NAEGR|nr:uncharacterized protein NAEGRDRAFT_70082 [Naegleria gruberi]EFC42038.1 predicted protein [Naegleria gruberi]|eukprot:XP_002674782.1 predicted protein [Naegleria gruberi strain NEG-M]